MRHVTAPSPISGPSRRSQWLAVLLLAALLLPYGARLDEFLLARSHGVVQVLDLPGLSRTCPTPLARWSPHGLLGSKRVLRRCGNLRTDHGRFRVVQSASLLPLAMSREEILDLLHAGGCFEVRWFGYEPDPRRGEPIDTSRRRSDNTIYHAAPCDAADCLPPPTAPARVARSPALPQHARAPALPHHAWAPAAEGVRLRLVVDVAPGARPEGVLDRARLGSAPVLRLRVAGPTTGQGTEAALALLADRLGLPDAAIRLVAGETARLKTVLIQGDPDDLVHRLEALAP